MFFVSQDQELKWVDVQDLLVAEFCIARISYDIEDIPVENDSPASPLDTVPRFNLPYSKQLDYSMPSSILGKSRSPCMRVSCG